MMLLDGKISEGVPTCLSEVQWQVRPRVIDLDPGLAILLLEVAEDLWSDGNVAECADTVHCETEDVDDSVGSGVCSSANDADCDLSAEDASEEGGCAAMEDTIDCDDGPIEILLADAADEVESDGAESLCGDECDDMECGRWISPPIFESGNCPDPRIGPEGAEYLRRILGFRVGLLELQFVPVLTRIMPTLTVDEAFSLYTEYVVRGVLGGLSIRHLAKQHGWSVGQYNTRLWHIGSSFVVFAAAFRVT